jgi:hypothetical protein
VELRPGEFSTWRKGKKIPGNSDVVVLLFNIYEFVQGYKIITKW